MFKNTEKEKMKPFNNAFSNAFDKFNSIEIWKYVEVICEVCASLFYLLSSLIFIILLSPVYVYFLFMEARKNYLKSMNKIVSNPESLNENK